ncbi:LysR substrate-binding domain-containing protein [uncultured Castellaniella sp.]|uniref:LysR substrate-binding domain-containing protein n=1 Tax=uncultured Castellaniella sp. TaxID=647907 RepID=UPI0026355089|nr:LysR substrate-binding domain-containing protein [uncultured Castellaniella sp.]
MRKRLPSTTALQAFEAAARHQSFTHAAQELSLTQGAICRQIATLEAFVGVPLFDRVRRGVRLTDAGERYGRLVRRQLDAIERDTLAIMAHQGGGVVDLAVVPTFATRWLLPRLAGAQGGGPGLQVNMTTRTRPFLFDDTEFDAAIYSGDPGWPGTRAYFLMRENPVPVCSPRLADGPLDAAAIAALPLLQQSTRPTAWRDWFASAGVNAPADMAGMRLELFSMLSQAAADGLGVALIPPFLIQRELDQGELRILNPHSGPVQRAFHLIVPERKTALPALVQFRDWLVEQARPGGPDPQGVSARSDGATARRAPLRPETA